MIQSIQFTRRFLSRTSSAGLSIPRNVSIYRQLSTAASIPPEAAEDRWHVIEGFTSFVSRLDLLHVLDKVIPSAIDPLLDRNLFPTGRYALLLGQDDVAPLKHMLKDRYADQYRLLEPNAMTYWKRSSMYKVNDRTLRTRGMPSTVSKEELEFMLEGYGLAPDGLQQLQQLDKELKEGLKLHLQQMGCQYLLHFKTAAAAERAMLELDGSKIDGESMALHWYQA